MPQIGGPKRTHGKTHGYTGKSQQYSYSDVPRIGDHICYYSDLRRMKEHYPNWDITKTLDDTISEIVESWCERLMAKTS